MTDYQKLYTMLFNAMTDAVDAMERLQFMRAREILIAVQRQTEEEYMEMTDEAEK